MFLRRNVASQTFTIPGSLRLIADGSAVTSGATLQVSKDGTLAAAAGTLAHQSGGAWKYTPTQGETDCAILGYILEGTGAITVAGSIRTTGADPNDAAALGLTRLDATVGSRSTYAGADTPGTTTLVGLITSQRATNLDNLDAAVSSRSTLNAAAVNAEVVDALATDTYAEPAAVPAATSSLKDKIAWLFALARNKITQTATTQALRNDADSANIATAPVSDDGTTFTRGEFS